jgi:hypothetical protein
MARASKHCIFCGGSPTTREHIWADWLRAFVPKNMVNHTEMSAMIHKDCVERSVRRWGGDPRSRRIQVVCRSCNNEWMSDLQKAVKPVLLPLIRGEPALLTPARQATVAAWAAMSVMCAEYFNPSRVAVPQTSRDGFYQSRTPPQDWKIWIGNYQRGDWPGHWCHNSLCIADEAPELNDEGFHPPNVQTTTFVVGKLYIHAFSCPYPDIVAKVQPAQRTISLLAQVWPLRENFIAWPPQAMLDRDADNIAASIFNMLDRIGRHFGA